MRTVVSFFTFLILGCLLSTTAQAVVPVEQPDNPMVPVSPTPQTTNNLTGLSPEQIRQMQRIKAERLKQQIAQNQIEQAKKEKWQNAFLNASVVDTDLANEPVGPILPLYDPNAPKPGIPAVVIENTTTNTDTATVPALDLQPYREQYDFTPGNAALCRKSSLCETLQNPGQERPQTLKARGMQALFNANSKSVKGLRVVPSHRFVLQKSAEKSVQTVDLYGDGLINFASEDTLPQTRQQQNKLLLVSLHNAEKLVDNSVNKDKIKEARISITTAGNIELQAVDAAPVNYVEHAALNAIAADPWEDKVQSQTLSCSGDGYGNTYCG